MATPGILHGRKKGKEREGRGGAVYCVERKKRRWEKGRREGEEREKGEERERRKEKEEDKIRKGKRELEEHSIYHGST